MSDYQLHHADCMDILPTLDGIDAVLTDPPYGLGDRWSGGTWFQRGVYNGAVAWDAESPVENVLSLVDRFSSLPCMIWGGNYFPLPVSRGWLVWNKYNSANTMADGELCWTNCDMPLRLFTHPLLSWPMKEKIEGNHPTQKPVALMEWCLQRLKLQPGATVLDPYMGSGTVGIACAKMGYKYIGIEIDAHYFDVARRRVSTAYGDIMPTLQDETNGQLVMELG
jgi:DNA modification methylase